MTLLDAPDYNPRRGIIIRNTIIAVAIALPIIAIVLWWTWLWPEEHRVDHFFHALEARNYSDAYGIWNHDPDWKQHEGKYSVYPFNDFMRDWGPKGEYGVIHSAKVVVSKDWGTGVIVGVLVNDAPKSKTLFLVVNKSTKTIGFSPVELRY
jgi:hypothetical protein